MYNVQNLQVEFLKNHSTCGRINIKTPIFVAFFIKYVIIYYMKKSIGERIATNLVNLRKTAKLTQLEFAQKVNYSDKAVSKWEKGESLPSVEVLEHICDFYGITFNDLVGDEDIILDKKRTTRMSTSKVCIILLCCLSIWLLATIVYVYAKLIFNESVWMSFVWTVPATCIIGIIFNSIWGRGRNVFILISLLIWTAIASFYLQLLPYYNAWIIFIIGIPLQLAVILWSTLHQTNKHLKRRKNGTKEKEQIDKA